MDVERCGHFMGIVFDGDGLGSILSDLAASPVPFVKELAVSPVVPAHKT